MASPFILGEDTKKALEGSFESLASRVRAAIVVESKTLFGPDKTPEVLGTYADHALVLIRESGEVLRVQYETSPRKEIVPISATVADLSTLTVEQAAKLAVRDFVEAFLGGAPATAKEQFSTLAKLSENVALPTRNASDIAKLDTQLQAASWKKIFDSNKEEIFKSLSESKNNRGDWAPKFRKLHDGSTAASELPAYEGLVTSYLKYMSEQVDKLAVRVSGLKIPVQEGFESFVESYNQDLTWLKNVLSETLESSKPIDVKSKIYDVLAGELNRYEVAGSFIEKMSRNLTQAATEEA